MTVTNCANVHENKGHAPCRHTHINTVKYSCIVHVDNIPVSTSDRQFIMVYAILHLLADEPSKNHVKAILSINLHLTINLCLCRCTFLTLFISTLLFTALLL